MKNLTRFAALLPLLITACAAEPDGQNAAHPPRLTPTALILTVSGDTGPVLGTGDTGQIELLRKGVDEPMLLEFRNGAPAALDLPPGEYSVEKIGGLYCRGMTFDIDPSADARALGSLQAKIITTDYYVALMSGRPATDAELDGLAAQTQTAPDSIDARAISVYEKAPCFAGTGGPGTTWQERPLSEKILLGIGIAGFCAIAVAAGGFCVF